MAEKDEQIGFHKGAISTLLKERQELVRLVQVVDALLKAHSEALQKLGVSLAPEKPKEEKAEKPGKKK